MPVRHRRNRLGKHDVMCATGLRWCGEIVGHILIARRDRSARTYRGERCRRPGTGRFSRPVPQGADRRAKHLVRRPRASAEPPDRPLPAAARRLPWNPQFRGAAKLIGATVRNFWLQKVFVAVPRPLAGTGPARYNDDALCVVWQPAGRSVAPRPPAIHRAAPGNRRGAGGGSVAACLRRHPHRIAASRSPCLLRFLESGRRSCYRPPLPDPRSPRSAPVALRALDGGES
jgi:hypothetical protein